MSCYFAAGQGGWPPEIFPIHAQRMDDLRSQGLAEMLSCLGKSAIGELPLDCKQFVGAALKPDGTAFYLTTIAPELGREENPQGHWFGSFFAPFGVGDIVGTVEADILAPGALPVVMKVKAHLLPDAGGNPATLQLGRTPIVSVEWEVSGNQATRPNKGALIKCVTIHNPGPHDSADIRKCIALHAPQRCFGMTQGVVAMQCGVAAACLLEAIC